MNKKYKVGIIGAGAIVESSHVPVLKILPDLVVEWVFDRDIKRSELVSAMFNVPVLDSGNIAAAIAGIDICLITIPYGARRQYIDYCVSEKKALYVEKPFAVSKKEHQDWCDLFAPGQLAIGFQRRYYRVTALLKKIVDEAPFGKLKAIRFNQGYFALKGSKEFLSNAALSGGGVIIESAIHTLDLLLLITGATSVEVQAVESLQKNGIDYDTVFHSVLSCKNNSVDVHIEVSALRNLDNGVHFIFEHASVSCGMSPDEKIKIFDVNGRPINLALGLTDIPGTRAEYARSISASFYHFWSDFLYAVDTKTPNNTSAVNSLLTTGWIEQVYTKINNPQ